MSKTLIFIGLFLIIIGLSWQFIVKVPFLGRLPGDVFIKNKNFTFYFPLTTSILISVLLSFIFWMVSKR